MVSYMDCKEPNQFFDKGILFKKKKKVTIFDFDNKSGLF
jgi:hypothetical protein